MKKIKIMLACIVSISLFTLVGTTEVVAAARINPYEQLDSKALFSRVVKSTATPYYYQTVVKNTDGTINHIATYYSENGGKTKDYESIVEFFPGTTERDISKSIEELEKKYKTVYLLGANPNVPGGDYKNQHVAISYGRELTTDYKSTYLMDYYSGATYNNKKTFIKGMYKQNASGQALAGVSFQQGTGNITAGFTFYAGTQYYDVYPNKEKTINRKKDVVEYSDGFIVDSYQLIDVSQKRNPNIKYRYSMNQISQYEILDGKLGYKSWFEEMSNRYQRL